MTTTDGVKPARRLGRSVLAVVGGLVAIFAASMAMDELMYALGVFPRPPAISYDTGAYLIATGYRAAIGVGGCWIAARLAPSRPMRHALILGGIGVLLSLAGVAASMTMEMGPIWYPVALVVVTPPAAWLGGRLAEGRA
jgi:hypothetical protein